MGRSTAEPGAAAQPTAALSVAPHRDKGPQSLLAGEGASNDRMVKSPENLRHDGLRSWVADMVDLCTPDAVHWCDGS
ncbi:hypothetical protein, partial [Ilumatobacter sp.]|uniref:hypothetical protein n=1 Tax=Ilumatobacter sp. TaxID=1967498 RepID=UPI002A29A30E|nr:hypothetical protein [Ilumatobacter sp.]